MSLSVLEYVSVCFGVLRLVVVSEVGRLLRGARGLRY